MWSPEALGFLTIVGAILLVIVLAVGGMAWALRTGNGLPALIGVGGSFAIVLVVVAWFVFGG